MDDYKELSAADLAGCLDLVPDFPHNAGALSAIDEATLAFRRKYPKVDKAQREFADARHRHIRSYSTSTGGYSDEAWQNAVTAAQRLADALRPLGSTRIARCKREAGFGTCNIPLDDDGECRSTLGHIDGDERA